MIDLSILVCSVHTRYRTFALRLQDQLWEQHRALPDPSRVEILILTDAMSMSIGAKRNALVHISRGKYVQFIDDDDRIADDMLKWVSWVAKNMDPDVIAFPAMVSLAGGPGKVCRYSMRYGHDYNTPTEYHRLPNHICAVRRELVVDTPFADICMGEDADYARRLFPKLTTEFEVSPTKPLYYYDYNPRTSECRR